MENNFSKSKAHVTYLHASEDGKPGHIVNNIHEKSIGGIKNAFDEKGYELLFPSSYLDTDEKKNAYAQAAKSLNEAIGKKAKFQKTLNENNLDATSGDFELFLASYLGGESPEFLNVLADLSKATGIDCWLTAHVVTQFEGYSISFISADMMMHTTHPAPGKDDPKGLLLSHYNIFPKFPYGFVEVKKGNIERERYGAYDKLFNRISADFLAYNEQMLEELFN
ncbi:MAG: hypothetical protein KI790_17495 [Cyclobacteriaceae bacterium]|nr:hypothetical protein [Cyclobacteriaceae bacterium HetDA_MAG_MS6]